jgi:hypothetical protein
VHKSTPEKTADDINSALLSDVNTHTRNTRSRKKQMEYLPESQTRSAVRARCVKQFVTAYTNKHGKVPTKQQIDKHVNDDLLLAKFASLEESGTQEIWDLVYDEGVRGLAGHDKKRVERLCDEWDIPRSSIAVRERVRVR